MRSQDGRLRVSASDLANHLTCRHLTVLNRAAVEGRLKAPQWKDPLLEILQQRGFAHEQEYVEALTTVEGTTVETIGGDDEIGVALEKTRAAMSRGTDVIVQATLASGRWFGRADILRKVPSPSKLGAWSYEIVDTKLASETRGGTILQLCLYADLIAEIQGVPPENVYVVSPKREPEVFRLLDFTAYYRLIRKKLEAAITGDDGVTYPEPIGHCDICRWWSFCDQRRRGDDHLTLVAGIRTSQRAELQDWGVNTLAALGTLPLPLVQKPRRGAVESYVRVREQARLQLARREDGAPRYELLPFEEGRGLALLPAPSKGDIFFDFEGDPFAGESGLEYLFGYVTFGATDQPSYTSLWAPTVEDERLAFEQFVAFVIDRWRQHPNMHIFHYAPYEPSALKRLMCRHGVCADQVDRMLRAALFVDLYTVVRQSLRASVEKYSIKDLEIFFDFKRSIDLRDASTNLRAMEHALELGQPEDITEPVRQAILGYNQDDCLAALHLRNWLEKLRSDTEAAGTSIARPKPEDAEPTEQMNDRQQRAQALADRLTRDAPLSMADRTPEQQARWLLAQLLGWHQRERKAPWWEYFRLRELSEEELLDERVALAGLVHVERVGGTVKCPIDRYSFPPQESGIEPGNEVHTTDVHGIATVEAIDLNRCTIDLKKKSKTAEVHPTSLFAHSVINSEVLEDAVFVLGEWVAKNGVDAPGLHRAARDLLLRATTPVKASGTGSTPAIERIH